MNAKRENALKKFQNHVAELQDLGDVKIITWKNADGSSAYSIRYLFDEKICTLLITGDCGTLTAVNFDNMVFDRISDFFGSYEYFASKVVAMKNGGPYAYNRTLALEQAKEYLSLHEPEKEALDAAMKTLEDLDFSDEKGFLDDGRSLSDVRSVDQNYWEWIGKCGKHINTSVIYMLTGLELAVKQLKGKPLC